MGTAVWEGLAGRGTQKFRANVVVSVVTSALKAVAAWWLKAPPEALKMRRVRGCFAGGQPAPPII